MRSATRRRAARLFAALAERDPANRDLARRAVSTAIEAGDTALALKVARRMAPDGLGLDARLLIVADLLARGRANDALGVINERTSDSDGGFLAPVLRGWAEQQARADGSARLANDPRRQPACAVRRRTARGDAARPQARRRGAAADRAGAGASAGGARSGCGSPSPPRWPRPASATARKALLVGDDPALKTLDLDRPQRGIAIDSPAAGFAELLHRARDRAGARRGSRAAAEPRPDRAPCRAGEQRGAFACRGVPRAARADCGARSPRSRRIPADDPFAEDALDAAARLLLAEKRGAEALALAQRGVGAARRRARATYARLGNVLDELEPSCRGGRRLRARRRRSPTARERPTAGPIACSARRSSTRSKRWPEARAQLELGLKASPDEPLLLNYLGYNSVERGENLDAAEAMIRRALALRPDDASITDSLGWALYKRGRLPEAIETLQKAQRRRPGAVRNQRASRRCPVSSRGGAIEARFAWRAALVTAEEAPEKARIEAKIGAGLTTATAAP